MALAGLAFLANAAGQNISVSNLLEAAKSDYKNGALDSALTKLDQAEKANGPSGESLDLRGSIQLEEGRFEFARRSFSEAHKREPALFAPRLHLGDLLLREKKFAEARAAFEQLLNETNVLVSSERLRYGILIAALAGHDDATAAKASASIKFPTQSPAYYYAQAAWEFAHGRHDAARRWIASARQIFEPQLLSWFARPLYEFGWLNEKPPPATLEEVRCPA